MKKDFSFISENSNKHKIKILLTVITLTIIFLGATIAFVTSYDKLITNYSQLNSLKTALYEEISALSLGGLFYTGLIGGLFFIPLPQEVFYYYGLFKGNPIILSAITVNAGFLLAQAINYFVGSRLNKIFIHLVSKRRLYRVRRFISKNGGKGVFLFNLLPLPAPLLTFALGITKYNIYRLYFYMIIGTFLKYSAIVIIFILVNAWVTYLYCKYFKL